MTFSRVFAVFALVFALPLAAQAEESPALVPLELAGTQWTLESINGEKPFYPAPFWFSASELGVGRGCRGLSAWRLEERAERLFEIRNDLLPAIAIHCAGEIEAEELRIGRLVAEAIRAERYADETLVLTTHKEETLRLRRRRQPE